MSDIWRKTKREERRSPICQYYCIDNTIVTDYTCVLLQLPFPMDYGPEYGALRVTVILRLPSHQATERCCWASVSDICMGFHSFLTLSRIRAMHNFKQLYSFSATTLSWWIYPKQLSTLHQDRRNSFLLFSYWCEWGLNEEKDLPTTFQTAINLIKDNTFWFKGRHAAPRISNSFL